MHVDDENVTRLFKIAQSEQRIIFCVRKYEFKLKLVLFDKTCYRNLVLQR